MLEHNTKQMLMSVKQLILQKYGRFFENPLKNLHCDANRETDIPYKNGYH